MKVRLVIILVVSFLLIPLFVQARAYARWHTSMGSFTAELYDEIAPITANNFISLTNSDFYNDLIFHRVVQGFVIQDGCPYGTGYGGPGYTIPDEFSPLLHHDQAGILAMAHSSAPNSAGSQYYITLAPTPHLDGNYAIFGKVIDGLNVVMAIGSVPVDANSRPLTPVNIHQVRMLDLHVASVFPDPTETILANAGEPLMFMIEAYAQTAQISYGWYIDDVLQSSATDFIYEPVINSAGSHTVRCHVASTDSISYDVSWTVQVSSATEDNHNEPPTISKLRIHPNPFRESVQIDFSLAKQGDAKLDIFNLKGRKVRTLELSSKPAGEVSIVWDGRDSQGSSCSPGVYYLKATSKSGFSLGKAILVH